MQHQASAWFNAALVRVKAKRPALHKFISIALIAPLFTVVVAATPSAQAATSTTTAPQDITATASGTTLNVTWGAPAYGANAVTAYQVDYSTDGTSWTTSSSTIGAGTYSYAITGLTSGTSYYVRVAAKMGASSSPWAYPWTKLYGTVTPKRDSSSNIVYEPGFGRAAYGNQAANNLASSSFTRVRYKMQYLSNSGATFNYVTTDFDKWTTTTGNKSWNGTTWGTYTTPAADISTLEFPDASNNTRIIQAAAANMIVESSDPTLNSNSITGRLEIWANNYSANNGWSGGADGSTTAFDYNDVPDPGNPTGFGSFQVHDPSGGRTIFAWNRHIYNSGLADIGIGNSPACGVTGTTDWTYCGSYSSSTNYYYNTTNRDAWKLETFINVPTLMTSSGLLMRWDAKNSSSYTSGGTWSDISGNGRNATLNNSLTSATVSNGSFNITAMQFNGQPANSGYTTGKYATIGSDFSFDYSAGFTVGFYADFGSAQAWERIIDIGNGSSAQNILVAREGTTSNLVMELYNGSATNGQCKAMNAIDASGTWAHYTLVFSPNSGSPICTIYKNGALYTGSNAIYNSLSGLYSSTGGIAYSALPTSNVTRSNAWIGRSNWSNDGYFEGYIADLAIYNRSLSLNEVLKLKEDQMASTVKAGDGTCATRVANPNNVTVTTVANDCLIKFSAPSNTTTSNKWIVPSNVSAARVLVIGGGGGGGAHVGSGAGAGGMIDTTTAVSPSTSIPITTGAGGTNNGTDARYGGYRVGAGTSYVGTVGANSNFGNSLIARGGGAGSSWDVSTTRSGGSGGGGTASGGTQTAPGVALDSTQGNDGGNDPDSCGSTYGYPTGGGGGAGGPGKNGYCPTYVAGRPGDGGIGKQSDITGSSIYYAGGGGGAGHNDGTYPVFQGVGGLGGGGNGTSWQSGIKAPGACSNTSVYGTQGEDGKGGGGGGVGIPASATCNGYAGRGGSGIVIVRYGTTTLSINANNGSGYTGTTSYTTSTYAYLTLPTQSGVTRAGYSFAGWNTSANGNGTNYPAGSLYQALGSQTLYAQWNSTISYNANGPTIGRIIDTTTATGSGPSTTLNSGAVLSNGIVTTGLDLYLDASNSRSYSGTGTTWYDLSGNGRNATAVGSPTYDSANGAFTFNGSSQYFDLGNANFNYQGTQPYTFAAWYKTTNATKGEQCVICRWTDNASAYGSFLVRLISGNPETYRYTPGSFQSSGNTAVNGTYYYMAASYDGTNVNIYINGKRIYSAASGAMSFNANINTYIGNSTANNRYFQGQIGVVQAYNIALTDGQVMQNYNALLNKSYEAELPTTPGSKAGYTFTGWATSSDTAAAVSSGTYATGLNALSTPYIRLKASDYDGTNWTPTNYTGTGISYLDSVRPTLKTNQTGWGTTATFSSVYGLNGKPMKLGNVELPAYTFCAMAKWPVNGITAGSSSGRMFTGTNVNWLDGWYYTNVGDTHHTAWNYDGSYNDYNWHYYCDTGNDIYLDGVKIISTYRSYTTLPTLSIGGGYWNGTGWYDYTDYEFAEIVIYDKVLSADQLSYVNRYFRSTYGFESGAVDAPSASLIPSGTFSSPGTSTLYAVWGSTITYEGNTASAGTAPAVQVFQRGTGTLATNTGNLSLKGKSFVGWNTKADGTGTFYAAGASYTGPDVTLYATFKAPVKITNTISGIDPITLAPYMRFKASDYNVTSKIWYDSSGNGRDTSYVRGSPSVVTTTANQNGSTKAFTTLQGTTADGIQFKNPTMNAGAWTIFSMARYNGTQSGSARVFDAEAGNFLFGFYQSNSGVAHYNGWVTTNANTYGTNWLASTGYTDYYRAAGVRSSDSVFTRINATANVTDTLQQLTINAGQFVSTDSASWQVAEVLIFDRQLSATEIQQVEDYLTSTYGLTGANNQNNYLAPATVNAAANSVTISDTYTAVLGYNNSLTVSPSIPGILLNTSVNTASLTVASTVSVGTYYETITATDYAGNTSSVPIQINVVNPIIWSVSNPSTVIATHGKPSKTRLDLSGGYGTRVALLSHSSSPAPRGVTIDTSTISSGYISLLTDTGTAAGTFVESITVTDGSRIVRTLLMAITVNAPPDITYSSTTDAPYPYRTSNLVLNVDPSNPSSYSGTGQTIKDISPTAKTFTFYNGSDVATNGVFTEASGGVLSLDGANLYAQSTSLPSMDTYTIEAWINLKGTNALNEWRSIVTDMYTTSGDKINFHLGTCGVASNEICGSFYDGTSWNARAAYTVNLNTWYHITYVVGGTTGSHTGYMYVNGLLVSTSSTTTSNPSTSNRGLRIGRRFDIANIFNGQIGAVRIYNTALNATQIAQDYANTKPRFFSLSIAAPTNSGNAILTTTEGKTTTYQVFAETGGSGNNAFALSGTNSTFSLASVGTDQTSLVISSATTATNATTAKTYYETLTATDSASAATAYYLTINVNPRIAIATTTDTVTTTFGKIAYDTITASYGTGTLQFTRSSSSGSSAITAPVTGTQALLTIAGTLQPGTYYETFTVTDSVSATSVKVIKIVVNPVLSVTVPDGTTLTTTITKAVSRRINLFDGTDTRTATLSVTSKDASSGITLDQTNLQAISGGYLTVNVGTSVPANTYTYSLLVRDNLGSSISVALTIIVNKWPTIQNVVSVSDSVKLSYDASVAGSATNTQWNDLSASAKNMTLTTGALATGESTGLISFNESATTTSYGTVTSFNSVQDTFSLETWIRISGRPTTEACIFCESGTGSRNFYFFVRSSGNIGGNYYNGGWGNQTQEFSSALNTWYHVVYTVFKVGNYYYQDLYINGAKFGTTSTASATGPNSANLSYVIGKSSSAADYLKMSMPLLRLYSRPLTSAEVQQNYLANLSRFTNASSGTANIVTTAGAATSSRLFTAVDGTGTKTFARTTSTSGVSLSSTADNTFVLNVDNTLTSVDSQTARTIYETVTATDSTSAASALSFSIIVNPPIIETSTYTTLRTTSGIETSTVIYATKGSSDKSFALTGDAQSGVSLTSGVNQATLRVLSTINPGTYWETITASDTAGATSSIAIKVIVNPGPTIIGRTTITSTTSSTYKSLGYYVANGTDTLTLTMSPSIAGITLDTSTAGVAYIKLANTLTSASTYFETLTVTDVKGATGILPVTIKIVAPISLTGSTSVVSTYGDSNLFSYTATGGVSPYNIAITGQQSSCITSKSTSGADTVEQFLGAMTAGTSCTWVVPNGVTTITGLIIAGGGQGGTGRAGGGGAGTMIEGSMSVTPGSLLTITVGAGGSNASCTSANAPAGCDGIDSIIGISGNTTYIVSKGGGGGGGHSTNYNGRTGGSGGGAGMNFTTANPATNSPIAGAKSNANIAPAGWTAYSNNGAATSDTETAPNNYRNTGGGGGAGSTGFPGICTGASPACNNSGTAGGARPDGGNGRANSITGTSTMYAGGGGGSVAIATTEINGNYKSAIAGNDYASYLTDKAGAGKGASPTRSVGDAATANSGSGGGGSITDSGGNGGSGIVVLRYATPTAAPTNNRISFSLINASTGQFNMTVPESITVGSYSQTVYVSSSTDAANIATTATISVVVIQDTPTATISLPGAVTSATYGTPVTISAATSTNGSVNFKKAGTTIAGCGAVATSNGLATCTWTPNAVETVSVTALLTPSDSVNYRTSIEADSALRVVVGPADTLTVTANNLTATYSESAGSANTTVPSRSFALSGLANLAGDSVTAVTYTFAGTINGGTSYSASATVPKLAGSYSITPSSPVFSSGATTNYKSVVYTAGTLTINRASRGSWSINFGIANSIRYGAGKTETPTATFNGDGTPTYSTSSSVCSVSTTGTITTLGVGSCALQVVLPQTNNWLSDTKTVTVNIDRGLRTATITPALTIIKYGDTTSVISTISPDLDSATVTYSNSNTLGCSVDNVTGQITGIKALASCSVKVTYDQTSLYESATASASVAVNRATAPIVTTDSITAVSYSGSTAIVTPTYKVSGILGRDISQILPLADVSTTAAINAITPSTYSAISSFRYFATTPTSFDSTTAPSLGGTYSVTPQSLTLLNGVDISNYETPTYVSSNLVINPIAQTPVKIQLSYLESITVPYDVVTTGGSSTGSRTLAIIAGGTATGCAVDSAVSAMRLKTSSPGTCVIQVTQAADRNYLAAVSDTQTVNILNFVVSILQLFDNPTGIAINHDVPFVTGDIACTINCQPTISGVTDVNGVAMTTMKVGTAFRIIGTNFNTTTAVLFTATLNGTRKSSVPADSFQVDSDTQITVMPPASFVPNGTDSVSNITVRIAVVASGGPSFPNSTIIAISL